ncbi:GMC family oxidoreductase [Streptomyces sp. NPDC005876]|uniref:GMC family oxidoreductase n=1 Tax=unclassified Streptomyces TaxID=2593676 RepID=UPI0033CB4ED7
MTADGRTPVGGSGSEHVDTLVIGSGFGGAVSAYRLAAAGHSVVLLERGRAHAPGRFPRTPQELGRAFWAPAGGLHGLFDVRSFRSFDSVVAAGLGGGSLIYANVLLRKDEHWFVDAQPLPGGGHESWPLGRADLEPHYDAVEKMLGATPYPLDRPPYDDTPKAHALRAAADRLGLDFRLPPLAVSFAPGPAADPVPGLPVDEQPYGNLHGVGRRTCRLTGACDLGCNEGAKNTLDHTYLSAARHHGADLRTGHEAQRVRPRPGGGYLVDYVRRDTTERPHGPAAGPVPATIGCDRLILAAGTYGTTYLLLRSRKHLPALGPALGTRFSTNGDLLGFAVGARDDGRPRPLLPSRGPVVTGALRLPDALDDGPRAAAAGLSERGGYIEDGGYPEFVQWLVESARAPQGLSRAARFALGRVRARLTPHPDPALSKGLSDLVGRGLLSSTSLPLLGMGRDIPDGVMTLRDGRLDVAWTMDASAAYFRQLRARMRDTARAMGAAYVDNPLWYARRVVAAHPVGGAPMSAHPDTGVCDPFGEVHGHPGLYIADGSALPGPVGTNPSLTIAALADRMSERLLETRAPAGAARRPGPTRPEEPGARPPAAPRRYTPATSLVFTESMTGRYTSPAQHLCAVRGPGHAAPLRCSARLTVTVDDVPAFLADPDHEARVDGWLDLPAHGGRRPLLDGRLALFPVDDPGTGTDRTMEYRLGLTDGAGRELVLLGRKRLTAGAPSGLWRETTTLPFRLSPPDDAHGTTATGTLRLRPLDFARQLASFRASGPGGPAAVGQFGRFFLGRLRHIYL